MACNRFRLALIQLTVGKSKADNLSKISKSIAIAANEGAKVIALPECCNSPYGNSFFPEYAETIPGESSDLFSKAARDNKIFLIAGSIPEKDDGQLFNTCTVFNPEGSLIGKYRKMHLFDIDIPGKIRFQESEILKPGNELTFIDLGFCVLGIGICYDLRFPELAQLYTSKGCNVLVYPGAFNMTTGPKHWELLQRGRANDNQLFVATCSPARDETATYIAWGHSTVVNPWGEVIAKADSGEEIVYADIDMDLVSEVRQQIPTLKQKRSDIYKLSEIKISTV